MPSEEHSGSLPAPGEVAGGGCYRRPLISIVARSTKRSNRRPDTLMQDRQPPNRRNFLRHTAGPYIGVKPGRNLFSNERRHST
jgi:hypothetical protein